MDIAIIVLLALVLIFLVYKEFLKEKDTKNIENFASLKAYIESLKGDFKGFNETLDKKMGETQTAFQRQFAHTAKFKNQLG